MYSNILRLVCASYNFRQCLQYSHCGIIDEDAIPTSLLNCCICDDSETPTQKLVQATPKVYPTLSGSAEAIGNAEILDHMKEACKAGGMRYHKECKRDLYNKSVKVNKKSIRK